MSMHPVNAPANRLPFAAAMGIVLLMWLAYSLIQTFSVTQQLGTETAYLLGFLPGILAIWALSRAGFGRAQCYLQVKPLSRKGLLVLAGVYVLALGAILPAGTYTGWSWRSALVYAPASGVAQELFFRASLLPALLALFPRSPRLALLGHATLFGFWHIGPLFIGAPLWAVTLVMLVPFISALGWGWQVQHDETVLWAMVQHSLIWVVGSPFSFGI